ncbi:hypothetical protein PROFUN_02501 [Planoprotostelium fungivorum]|uniref:Uncharacterized protein n=1 Tax=Planoprotostelium fungivorum TaxID=1890364 RepID=A0A2P6MP78_9EUKA|nr:hypothetical protein PROFUN_02501 [Planoprotostelium fungivorum]
MTISSHYALQTCDSDQFTQIYGQVKYRKDPSSTTKRSVTSLGDNHKSPKGTIRSSKDIAAPLVFILKERGLLQEETKMDKEKMVNSPAMNTIPIQQLLNSIHLDCGYFLHARQPSRCGTLSDEGRECGTECSGGFRSGER